MVRGASLDLPPANGSALPFRPEEQTDGSSDGEAGKNYRAQVAEVAVIAQRNALQLATVPWSGLVVCGREEL